METIFKADKGTWYENPQVEEIQIESRTEKFYKKIGYKHKDAFETSYYKCFLSEQEAIEFLRQQRINEVEHLKQKLEQAEYKLEIFNQNNPKP